MPEANPDLTLAHISLSRPRTVPMGPLYIATVLGQAGLSVELRDFVADSYLELEPDRFVSFLEDSAPVLGVSCMSDVLPFVLCALEQFKRQHPGKTLVLGGAGPTGVAAELLESFSFVDAVVLGEGEETALELMRCLSGGSRSDLDKVRGIAYRNGAQVHVNGRRERIRDLDQLPLPTYGSVSMTDYRLVNIVGSRGCPFKCTFCDVAPMWQRRNLRRSVDSIIDEIILLRDDFGTRSFEFSDETFVLNQKHVLTFCERLRREDLDVEWACTGRIDLMNPELLSEMRSSGCRAVFYGVESGSDHVLRQIKKEFTAQQAVEVILETRKHMHVVASFIWGFPEESRDDFLKTLFLILYLEQHGVDARLNRLSPFALTPLFEQHRDDLVWLEDSSVHAGHDPFQISALRPEVADLVRAHPGVFPEFGWLPTPELTEKLRMVDSLSRHRHSGGWPAAPGEVP